MTEALHLDQFDFTLTPDRIAQAPARPRDASRLLVVPRDGALGHQQFTDLPELLAPGDVLVVNRTKVIPARLHLRRPTGGQVELLLYRPLDGTLAEARTWEGLGRPGSALQPGKTVLAGDVRLAVLEKRGPIVHVRAPVPLWPILQAQGEVPLPPYVQREAGPQAADDADYQTMFAEELGAVAAPTASLHFTPRVMEALAARGVLVHDVVLHVGPGTFLPIRPEHASDVRQHSMHSEPYTVPESTEQAIAQAKARGNRVIAVGTTSLRALETWAATGARSGESTLFVYPGFTFRVVDALVTNFHLPRSTLLLLVAAFAGRERILAAYHEAIRDGYRFYSYGDAMLLC